MVSTRGHFLVLGGNPFHGFDTLDSRMGSCLWDLSLGKNTGNVRFDGETFLGGLLIFFLGGRGEGRGTPEHDCRGAFVGQHDLNPKGQLVRRGSGSLSTDGPGACIYSGDCVISELVLQ
jgi:hypothetical protein